MDFFLRFEHSSKEIITKIKKFIYNKQLTDKYLDALLKFFYKELFIVKLNLKTITMEIC